MNQVQIKPLSYFTKGFPETKYLNECKAKKSQLTTFQDFSSSFEHEGNTKNSVNILVFYILFH